MREDLKEQNQGLVNIKSSLNTTLSEAIAMKKDGNIKGRKFFGCTYPAEYKYKQSIGT